MASFGDPDIEEATAFRIEFNYLQFAIMGNVFDPINGFVGGSQFRYTVQFNLSLKAHAYSSPYTVPMFQHLTFGGSSYDGAVRAFPSVLETLELDHLILDPNGSAWGNSGVPVINWLLSEYELGLSLSFDQYLGTNLDESEIDDSPVAPVTVTTLEIRTG